MFDAPAWSLRALIAALAIGFIPAMVLSWVCQWTPRGFKRDPAESERAGRMSHRRRSDQASAASPNSIAVLPLKTLDASEETQRLAERLHDDLLNRLSQIRALKVRSRTSLFEYRDGNKTLPEIGRELGVATVLEGSLQHVRSWLRLNAQLIDVRADTNVWADSFDLPADDDALFDLQVEVALAIAEALKAQLLPQDTEALGRRLSADPQALSAWREAQDFINRANAGDFDRAAALLDTAQARDPSFAAVRGLRARNAIARFWFSEPDEQLRRQSLTELEKARVLDPDAPELLVAEAYYHYDRLRLVQRTRRVPATIVRASPDQRLPSTRHPPRKAARLGGGNTQRHRRITMISQCFFRPADARTPCYAAVLRGATPPNCS